MKKLIAITLCSLPLAMVSTVYAQTTAAPAAPAAPTEPATPAPAPAAPTAPGGDSNAAGTGMAPAAGAANAPAEKPAQTVTGWSVKDKIIGKSVYNEKKEKVGDIDDVILADDGKAVYFVVGAGGFLGMGAHDVAIPFDKITKTEDSLVLEGYTKDQLKAMPEVKVSK